MKNRNITYFAIVFTVTLSTVAFLGLIDQLGVLVWETEYDYHKYREIMIGVKGDLTPEEQQQFDGLTPEEKQQFAKRKAGMEVIPIGLILCWGFYLISIIAIFLIAQKMLREEERINSHNGLIDSSTD